MADRTPPHGEEPEEVVDGLPVLAGPRILASAPPARSRALGARQAAAMTATGFVAGAATAVLVARRARTLALRGGRRRRRKGPLGEIVASNSFLIDVHVLRRR